ncbi:hypothetical protein AMS68_002493 [Peltaster fructicola]|uniref:Major facilitator superfamily (MFS) profile domain-containing protein n=1 Tax=Peltaster fructicola TaxID=286661 RepID=A0A6H0XQL0_9PEZI|nr:hypothetical protein AMS68_002493 [Peltaster fructicola]
MQSFLQYRRLRTVTQRQLDSKDRFSTSQDPEKGRQYSRNPSDSSIEKDADADEKAQEPAEESEPIAEDHSTGAALGQSLTGVEVRQKKTNEPGDGKVFEVGWQGDDDPENPHNWSLSKRTGATVLVACIGFIVGMASSIDSSALKPAAMEFGVAPVVESMATGLFLIGFGVGAMFAGCLSETVGRNPVYIVTLGLYMIFIMAAGLAPNIGAQLAFRFIAGCFAATPLVCAGGSLSDLWNPRERTISFVLFANSSFTGPVLGPLIGGWIVESPYLGWRWCEWITLIGSGLVTILVILFQPETFSPILLTWKARHLRAITGDDRYKAPAEVQEKTFFETLKTSLARPFIMTAQEPIIILFALYLTVIYIVLFTFLDGYDYIFGETYGLSGGLTGTCFAGIAVGVTLASALVPIIYRWQKQALEERAKEGIDHLPPEFRLWYSMLGGAFAIPISLFWMGWTAYPSVSIASPLIASVFFGFGILCVFITTYQYIIDSYETYAASALASVTMIRYMSAGGMTIVGIPFYENLGVHYTLTILACLSALMVPVPYVFYKYGAKIRSKSKFATSKD